MSADAPPSEVMLPFSVTAPASSANLATGFDTLALALDLRLRLRVDVALPEAPEPAVDNGLLHLAEGAAEAVYKLVGRQPEQSLRLRLDSPIPAGRGLGSSAAAQAAGLVAANLLLGQALSDAELLDLLAGLEGHGDNAAAALFGGLTWTWREGEHTRALALPPPPLEVALAVPRHGIATSRSRSRLPHSVALVDAVHNLQRGGLWLAAAAAGDWNLLWAAADDRLHQPARARHMPYLEPTIAAAREAGAMFAALSGSGTSVMALTPAGHSRAVADAMVAAMGQAGVTASARRVRPSTQGVRIWHAHAQTAALAPT
jgi:homoserine kinase